MRNHICAEFSSAEMRLACVSSVPLVTSHGNKRSRSFRCISNGTPTIISMHFTSARLYASDIEYLIPSRCGSCTCGQRDISTRVSEVADICSFGEEKHSMFIYRFIGGKNRAHYSAIQILRFGAVAPKTFGVGPINKTSDNGAFQQAHCDSAETLGARKWLLGTNCAKLHEDILFKTSLPARGYSLISSIPRYVYLMIAHKTTLIEPRWISWKINTSSLSMYVVVCLTSLFPYSKIWMMYLTVGRELRPPPLETHR